MPATLPFAVALALAGAANALDRAPTVPSLASVAIGAAAHDGHGLRVAETRRYRVVQTVSLHDVSAASGQVRLWVPIPGDAAWQRVLDQRVVAGGIFGKSLAGIRPAKVDLGLGFSECGAKLAQPLILEILDHKHPHDRTPCD